MRFPPLVEPVLRRRPLSVDSSRKSILELDLTSGVSEVTPGSPVQALRARHVPVLRTVVERLRSAETDDDVLGLVATVGPGQLTLAQSGELREAVASFRRTGRATVAFSPTFGELTPGTTAYHLATAFEEIWLQPTGLVGMVGFAGEAVFLRGALDRLGVEPQLSQRHEYKSAADMLLRSDISEPHREMLDRLLASATQTAVDDISAARRLDPARIRDALDAGPLSAHDAQERGLVDHLGYRDEAYRAVRERLGGQPALRYVQRYRPGRLDAVVGRAKQATQRRPVVGIVEAAGPIHLGRTPGRLPVPGPSVGSDALGAVLRAAARDERVKAIVLRINSPGGSYVASDAIRREILVLRESGTPVVASMGSVAASGGYYIAMPCDAIVAGAGTITGSIGVLAGKSVIREGLERLGITRTTVSGSPRAAMFSTNRPFAEEETALLERWLDEVYDDFTSKAAADRGMPIKDLRAVARGRVWTGSDAAERGLVDTLGGLETAVHEACRRAGLGRDEVEVRSIPRPHPLRGLLPSESSDAVDAGLVVGEGPALWQRLVGELTGATVTPYVGVLSLPPLRLPGLIG